MKTIAHNKPTIEEEEIRAVEKVLRSNSLIGGKEAYLFEQQMKDYVGMKYAAAVISGTSSLHLSLLAMEIEPDDEIIVPTYTAADILNAIFYVKAKPIVCDIEKNSCNIDIKQIQKKITKKTKAMIIPHTFGIPIDIEKIKQFNIPIIEDCAQALGSKYDGKVLGSFGDISIFSFYATKLITTGQGGIVMTNNRKYYSFIKDVINYNARKYYLVRYNYPMTDIAASIGNIQIKKLPAFIKKRQELAKEYIKILKDKSISSVPDVLSPDINPFRFLLKFSDTQQQKKVKAQFREAKIDAINPIKRYELFHNLLKLNPEDFPHSENFVQTVLSIPIYPSLTSEEAERILDVLRSL